MDLKSKIILISGPTASGKSIFALKVAKKINPAFWENLQRKDETLIDKFMLIVFSFELCIWDSGQF